MLYVQAEVSSAESLRCAKVSHIGIDSSRRRRVQVKSFLIVCLFTAETVLVQFWSFVFRLLWRLHRALRCRVHPRTGSLSIFCSMCYIIKGTIEKLRKNHVMNRVFLQDSGQLVLVRSRCKYTLTTRECVGWETSCRWSDWMPSCLSCQFLPFYYQITDKFERAVLQGTPAPCSLSFPRAPSTRTSSSSRRSASIRTPTYSVRFGSAIFGKNSWVVTAEVVSLFFLVDFY